MMPLTHDELVEVGCALLEAAFAAREAARSAPDQASARQHQERASLLLSALRKLHSTREAQQNVLRSVS